VGSVECLDHLFRPSHLGHPARVHEARDLDRLEPGADDTVDELSSDGRSKDVGLVLKTVPRPDVDHGDARMAGHAITLQLPL
jgi:hypothetical protein